MEDAAIQQTCFGPDVTLFIYVFVLRIAYTFFRLFEKYKKYFGDLQNLFHKFYPSLNSQRH